MKRKCCMEITGKRDDKSAIFTEKLVFVLVLKKRWVFKNSLLILDFHFVQTLS